MRSIRGSSLTKPTDAQLMQMFAACLTRLNREHLASRQLRDIRKLAEIVNELELRAAIAARYEGLSWEQIGRRLDVSRQAAQQRFKPQAQPNLTPATPAQVEQLEEPAPEAPK